MKKQEFTRKDGTTGFNYSAEAGDEVTALADSIYERETLGVNKETGQPFKATKYGIQVKTAEGEEVFLNLTAGQKKGIKGEVLNKTLVFYAYENEYGPQVGCKVKE